MSLSEELQEKLEIKNLFSLKLGNFELPVSKGVVVSWGIILFLVILSIILTRNLKVQNPGKRQAFVEFCMEKLYNIFYSILGERGKKYVPFLITMILYLGVANILGLFGITPPTKELNTTAGMALLSIVYIQIVGIREFGVKGWLKSFSHPSPIMIPMNLLELIIKPLSLCMRLFGNVLGAYIIMELIIYAIPAVLPLAASMYFDIFDGLLQAYVFCFLTTLYIHETLSLDEE